MYRFFIFSIVFTMCSYAYAAPRGNQASRSKNTRATRTNANTTAVNLQCKVQGTPTEFPDDITIQNKGKSSIKRGTKLAWSVKGKKGTYALKSALKPGKFVVLSGVLGSGLEAGTPCQVSISKSTRKIRRVRKK